VLHHLVVAAPKTIGELLTVSGIGPRISDVHGAAIVGLCRGEGLTMSAAPGRSSASSASPTPRRSSQPEEHAARRSASGGFSSRSGSELSFSDAATPVAETFHRSRVVLSEPADDLTPEQQALDARLREWRRSESERLNLPLFFVLASTTLRSIVLARPQSLAQLKTVHGLGNEKVERFGAGILEACNS
jgi:ATP-dependent DNA helicase RecQ